VGACAGRHPLVLAARQLPLGLGGEAKVVEQLRNAHLSCGTRKPAETLHRQHDILSRREFRQQEMELQHLHKNSP